MKLLIVVPLIFAVGCVSSVQKPKEPPQVFEEVFDRSKYSDTENVDLRGITLIGAKLPPAPQRAVKENQQGWCAVKFDIAATGKTKDSYALECSPEGYFEDYCEELSRNMIYDTNGKEIQDYFFKCTFRISG